MEAKHLASLFGGGFWSISRQMVKAIGLYESLWIVQLYDYRMRLIGMKQIGEDDFFYVTKEFIEEETGISVRSQSDYINRAVERGYLEVKRIGIPAQNYYKLDPIKMTECIYQINADRSANATDLDRRQTPANIIREELRRNSFSLEKECVDEPNTPLPKESLVKVGIKINRDKVCINRDDRPVPRKKILSDIEFLNFPGYTKEAKTLFLFWNRLPSPIPHHRIDPSTKLFHRALEALDKTLNMGHSPDSIRSAMENYQKLLLLENSKLPPTGEAIIVSLNDFVCPSGRMKALFKQWKLEVKSWFDECRVPFNRLLEKYSKVAPDKYPEITEALKKSWPGRKNFTPQEENTLRITAVRAYNYFTRAKDFVDDMRVKHGYPASCAHFVWDLISKKDHNDFGTVPYWIQSEMFFASQMEEYLREINYIVPGYEVSMGHLEDKRHMQAVYAKLQEDEDRKGALSQSDFI